MRSNRQKAQYRLRTQYLLEKSRFRPARSTYPRSGLFSILLAYPRFWTKNEPQQKLETQRNKSCLCGFRFSLRQILKSYLYPAPQHSPLSVQFQGSFLAQNTRLKIKYISRIDDRLRTERQAEVGQTLRYEHAHARIINSQSPLKWIDGKNRGLR